MDLVRCRRICAVRFSIHASHCCGERAFGPSAPPGVWYMGYGFAGMRRSSAPPTARRHTQVPPYIPGRTADMVRRAGPMCPAAGTHRKPPNGPICSDRVGRGLAPAVVPHWVRHIFNRPRQRSPHLFTLHYSLLLQHKAAVRHPLTGWGRRPSALPGIAPSADGALGRWGVSRRARRGYFARCGGRPGLCPWTPEFFREKIQ